MVLLPTDKQSGFRGTIDKNCNKAVAGDKRLEAHQSILSSVPPPLGQSSLLDAIETRIARVPEVMEQENQPPVTGPRDTSGSELEVKSTVVKNKGNSFKKARGGPLASLDTNALPQLAYTAEPSAASAKLGENEGDDVDDEYDEEDEYEDAHGEDDEVSRVHELKRTVESGDEKLSETVDGEVPKIAEDSAKEISVENNDRNEDRGSEAKSQERVPSANTGTSLKFRYIYQLGRPHSKRRSSQWYYTRHLNVPS
ncbi:hypothetical protein NMY22_g11480 [Coprinellus aureogranulatus]|nr:hypothetical protein NMY22_g11480 [Coprinellus aureogranulatus]